MLTRAEQNRRYDLHNPGRRKSPSAMDRMYGRCGCRECGEYRKRYMAQLQSPIDERGTRMGSINSCDRCGSLVTGNALGNIRLLTSSDTDTSETVSRELCPGCIEELVTLVTLDVEPRERAYKKPFVLSEKQDDVDKATLEQLLAAALEKAMKTNSQRELEA